MCVTICLPIESLITGFDWRSSQEVFVVQRQQVSCELNFELKVRLSEVELRRRQEETERREGAVNKYLSVL